MKYNMACMQVSRKRSKHVRIQYAVKLLEKLHFSLIFIPFSRNLSCPENPTTFKRRIAAFSCIFCILKYMCLYICKYLYFSAFFPLLPLPKPLSSSRLSLNIQFSVISFKKLAPCPRPDWSILLCFKKNFEFIFRYLFNISYVYFSVSFARLYLESGLYFLIMFEFPQPRQCWPHCRHSENFVTLLITVLIKKYKSVNVSIPK